MRRSLVRQALDAAAAAGSPIVFAEFDGCPHLEAAHRRGLLVPAASIAKAVREGLLVGYDGKPTHWSCALYSRSISDAPETP